MYECEYKRRIAKKKERKNGEEGGGGELKRMREVQSQKGLQYRLEFFSLHSLLSSVRLMVFFSFFLSFFLYSLPISIVHELNWTELQKRGRGRNSCERMDGWCRDRSSTTLHCTAWALLAPISLSIQIDIVSLSLSLQWRRTMPMPRVCVLWWRIISVAHLFFLLLFIHNFLLLLLLCQISWCRWLCVGRLQGERRKRGDPRQRKKKKKKVAWITQRTIGSSLVTTTTTTTDWCVMFISDVKSEI